MTEVATNIDNKSFSESFEEARDGGLSLQEQQKLRDLFFQLPLEEQKKVLEKYNGVKEEPEKSFFDGLRNNLNDLKAEIEQNSSKGDFETLKENFEDNESMKELLDIFGSYIEIKLDKSFTDTEKETIKLALLGEVQKSLNIEGIINLSINKILKPIKNLIDLFNNKELKNVQEADLTAIETTFKDVFEKMGLPDAGDFVNNKIEKLNKDKKNNKTDIKDIETVFDIIKSRNKGELSKEQILENSKKLAETLKKGRNLGNQIKDGIEKLPFGDVISDWIKNIIKEGGILGFILGFLFGKEFLDEKGNIQKQSIQNLVSFSEESDFPLKNNFKTEKLKELTPKKLEDFYKFLDSKKIDYSTDTFWQELLTGKTKNNEILKIHNLLLDKDNKLLKKEQGLDDFINKLNSLENLESKKEAEHRKKRIEQLNTEIANSTSTKDKQKQEELKLLKQTNEFIDSINAITSLPSVIIYKGKEINLNIENNQIILGTNKYRIEVSAKKLKGKDIFKNISYDGNNLILKTTHGGGFMGLGELTTTISKKDFIGTIETLLDHNNYEKILFNEKGEEKARLKIIKI